MSNVDDPLLAVRDQFPILAQTNYLISNSLGAVPEATETALRAYFETWASRGVRAWEETWWGLSARLGDQVASLIGAGANEVIFQSSVTLTHAIVFSAFDYRNGRSKIVTDALHFPSILYLLAEQRQSGAEVEIVPTEDGTTIDTARLIETIDERTAFVNISHVLFKSAYIHEIPAITERARQVGALTIIDGYQAVGVLPVDVRKFDIDVYIGGCLKWLCGGPGAAFLWVRPDLRTKLTPRLVGWMSHVRPFQFEPELVRRDDAWRFLVGTPNISALYAARPGLEIINTLGIAAIRAKSERQTARLLALADRHGLRSTASREPSRRGGTVALDVPHGLEVSRALKAREILCDYRPGAGIRLSPHFYTRDEELDVAIDTLVEILATDAWKPFCANRSDVT